MLCGLDVSLGCLTVDVTDAKDEYRGVARSLDRKRSLAVREFGFGVCSWPLSTPGSLPSCALLVGSIDSLFATPSKLLPVCDS
jgi:hypothetical protein